MVTIRTEMPFDIDARENLLDRVWGPSRFQKTAERLREGREPSAGLSFVAEHDGDILALMRGLKRIGVRTVTFDAASSDEINFNTSGLQVLATTLDGETSLDDAELAAPTAWLFGPESHGLSAEVADEADHRVRIPMSGGADSLNVASAAAICLYQSARALGRGR